MDPNPKLKEANFTFNCTRNLAKTTIRKHQMFYEFLTLDEPFENSSPSTQKMPVKMGIQDSNILFWLL